MNTTPDPHDHPDLLALLRGELSNAATTAAGTHLRTCLECREELTDAAVGHALLTRSAGTLGLQHDLVDPLPPLQLPGRWERRRGPLLLVAAAVLVVAGVAGGLLTAMLGDEPESVPQAVPASISARLDPVTGEGDGRVTMVAADAAQTRMTIEVQDLPTPLPGEYYYAWLLDPSTNKMLPLGQVGPGGSATFALDDALLTAYSAVDVSLEADDGDPEHSVTSVLRGSYPPGPVDS